MPEFNVRSDSVDVEQIMRQIRARIREKRGVDYTEEQVQELARVKLEKFLDPRGLRSDLLQEFQRTQGESPPDYDFDGETMYTSQKAHVRFFRKLFKPLTQLILSRVSHALTMQAGINRFLLSRHSLAYELMHNLVVEVTRSSIEVRNLKMRVESLSSRLDFAERRARALEAIVQYQPEALGQEPAADRSGGRPDGGDESAGVDPITGGESLRTRRRRRRRGRRSGPGFSGPGGDQPSGHEAHPAADRDRSGRPASDEARGDAASGSAESPAETSPAEPPPGERSTDES